MEERASIPEGAPTATSQMADLEAIYRAHVRSLYAFVYSKVGNREAAEDITADVFTKALTRLDPTREEHSIVAWLFRVARNAVADHWRSGQGVPVILFEEAHQGRRHPALPNRAREAQTAAQAHALLDQLPQSYRAVLTYRLLEGLSVTETAQRMGTTTANVKVMQHRALKRAAQWRSAAPGAATSRQAV